jgi:hypothetical protein
MVGEPTLQERKMIEKRIRAVSAFKLETYGQHLPVWLDIDEIAPGTSTVGTGIPDKRLATYDRQNRAIYADKRRNRNTGVWDEKQLEKRVNFLSAWKAAREGIIGLSYTRTGRVVAMYDGTIIGRYATFQEAAEAYDAMARKYEKRRAVTNDPEAVKREDRRLEVMKRMRETGGKMARFAGGRP